MEIKVKDLDKQVTMRDVVTLLGGRVDNYPVIGDCISIGDNRTPERDIRDTGNVAISYQWIEKKLIRIFIGHKHAGIMLECSKDDDDLWVWRNCYSHRNYGKNYSNGGTWSCDSKQNHETAKEAIKNRDYRCSSIVSDQQYLESPLLLNEVLEFIDLFE